MPLGQDKKKKRRYPGLPAGHSLNVQAREESYNERTQRLGKKTPKLETEHRPTCPTCPGAPPMKNLYERIGSSGKFVASGIFMCPSCRSFSRRR